MNIINYVDTLPGMGKTEWAVREMADHILNDRDGILIYVAPTIELLKRVHEDRLVPLLRAKGGKPRHESRILRIHSSKRSSVDQQNTIGRIRGAIEGSVSAGGNLIRASSNNCVMLITHASFFCLPFKLQNKEQTSIIFDEARKCVFEPRSVDFTDAELELFEQYLQDGPPVGSSEYRQVTFNSNPEKLIELQALIAKVGKKGGVNKRSITSFVSMVEALKRGTTEVYCLRKKSKRTYREDGVVKKRTTLKFYEVHIPSNIFFGWRSATVMSAYLKHTQLWALMCRGAFMLDGKICRMEEKNGRWRAVPARRNVDATHGMRDVTAKVIPRYQTRLKEIQARYKRVHLVTLSGSSKVGPSTTQLISSAKLSGIFVDSKARAKDYGKQLSDLWKAHAQQAARVSVKGMREILYAPPEQRVKETASEFAQAIRDWFDSIEKLAPMPYLWYLKYGLHVARQWFKNEDSSPIPLLLANINHTAHMYRHYPHVLEKIKQLPHACHGRDDFKDHCILLFQAAINPKREAMEFYRSHIAWYDYNQDHVVDAAIQAATRTSMRDTTRTEDVLIVVPDPYLASLLSQRLGDIPVVYATEQYGVPKYNIVYIKKPDLTRNERVSRYRNSTNGKRTKELTAASPFFKQLNAARMQLTRARKANDTKKITSFEAVAKQLSKQHTDWMNQQKE